MEILDSLLIGAGQAGLSASYHLLGRGLSHVVLDADEAPGGAWQHRWDSLTTSDAHGVAAMPDSPADWPASSPGVVTRPASVVVPAHIRRLRTPPRAAGAAADLGRPGDRVTG